MIDAYRAQAGVPLPTRCLRTYPKVGND